MTLARIAFPNFKGILEKMVSQGHLDHNLLHKPKKGKKREKREATEDEKKERKMEGRKLLNN